MKNKNNNIGIIGGGFIGQTLKRYWPKAKIYDIKPGEWDSLKSVLKQEYIFIAINFEDNCRSIANQSVIASYLEEVPEGRKVVIKSTLVPGTTEYFENKYKDLLFCYNPEFLTEATSWEDFTNPEFQILGLTKHSSALERELFELLPKSKNQAVMLPREAEILKHALNSYFATKVIFFNQLYDACTELYADYEKIEGLMTRHPWVGASHSKIWHKGYRGFGGKCLPKDIAALAKSSNFPLLEKVIEINENITSKYTNTANVT
jgi:UDPglucose 6-dehydrogenase